jgi:hypothetical protein
MTDPRCIVLPATTLILFSIAVCSSAAFSRSKSAHPPAVFEADEKMVEGCQFLGTLVESSIKVSADDPSAIERAKKRLIEAAAKKGATALVYSDLGSAGGASGAHLVAKAYRCEVVEADEKMVEGCKFLGTVHQRAAVGTQKTAWKEVMKEATKLGATHVVFIGGEEANMFTFGSATGRAYRCEKGSPPNP